MLRFFRDNSYDIFKMMVNQIGITIFGLVMTMATYRNDILFLAAGIFSILFYLFLLYTMTWEIGNAEKVRIDSGRQPFMRLKGLYLSLFANIINFIFALLANIGYYAAETLNDKGFPIAPDFAADCYGIGTKFAGICEAMYDCLIGYFLPENPWFLFVIIIPALLTCTFAYIAGVKGVHLTKWVGQEQSKE